MKPKLHKQVRGLALDDSFVRDFFASLFEPGSPVALVSAQLLYIAEPVLTVFAEPAAVSSMARRLEAVAAEPPGDCPRSDAPEKARQPAGGRRLAWRRLASEGARLAGAMGLFSQRLIYAAERFARRKRPRRERRSSSHSSG